MNAKSKMTKRTAILKVDPATAPVPGLFVQRKCACGGTAGHTGKCEACRKKRGAGTFRRADTRPSEVPPVVHDVLRAPGEPLDPATLAFMEPRFGNDFSRVRVHHDQRAGESARAINARAYTAGENVVFEHGQYLPHSESGKRLLAHELAHVVQQKIASPGRIGAISHPQGADEIEADRAAAAVTEGKPVLLAATHPTPALQRQAHQGANVREQIITLGESEDAADRQRALDLILATYYERPAHFGGLVYDGDRRYNSPQDAETGPSPGAAQYGGEQTTHIGPRFFNNLRDRFDQRVRTIGHELQHVGQRSPANQRSFGRTLGGVGAGLAAGFLVGMVGLGLAAGAGATLGTGLIGGVLAGSAALGGLIGGLADPFRRHDEPIRDRNTREFLAIHWVVTAPVRGIEQLSRGQRLLNINVPGEGALDRYQHMPPEDQKRYRRQYEEILEIKRRLESEETHGSVRDISPSPESPDESNRVRLA